MKTAFITLKNTRIAYQTQGKGKALFFLHGFCEQRRMWDNFTGVFLEKYQVVTIDLPGYGESELFQKCTIEMMAEAVNVVREALNIDSFNVIGHSMGGYVALALAEQYPKSIESITLFHSHPFEDSATKKVVRARGIKFIEKNGTRIYLQQMIPTLFTESYRKAYKTFVYQLIKEAMEIPQITIVDTANAMLNRKDRADVLEKIDCPVLFIVGKEDEAVPYELSLAQSHLPSSSKLHIQHNVGHMGMYEDKENSQEAIQEFLDFISNSQNSVSE